MTYIEAKQEIDRLADQLGRGQITQAQAEIRGNLVLCAYASYVARKTAEAMRQVGDALGLEVQL